MQRVSIIGGGRLGICASLLMESKGISVMVMDTNKSYLEQLHFRTYKTPEPQVEELLKNARQIEFTASLTMALEFSPLIFCFVPTPSLVDDSYSTEYVEQVIEGVYTYIENGGNMNGKTFVLSSTVMPRYCESLQNRLKDFGIQVIYCPTMIAQGSIVNDLINSDIILVGTKTAPPNSFFDVFDAITANPNYKVMSHTGAEITKIATNCFLSLKIAYSGLIGDVCLESGLHPDERDTVLEAIGSDKRVGNHYFKYGLPASGLCIPRDTRALNLLLKQIDIDTSLIDGLHSSNTQHLNYIFDWIRKEEPLNRPLEIYQLSYKKGVPILTESNELELCIMLLKYGYDVNIIESESVIEQAKPILKQWEFQITYTVKE